jgi:hypothetical protein
VDRSSQRGDLRSFRDDVCGVEHLQDENGMP